ncbi:MAG TPA: sigma-70 family RNA polymerase sigma factor, partial [Clostridia bacterium]|nr:sigma-70 family RNA polymerase sigma factor [Clostridia bacterium]
ARAVTEELRKKIGREPNINELSEAMGIDKDELILALDSMRLPLSIYDPIFEDDSSPVLLVDVIAEKSPDIDIEDKILLKEAISELEPDERKVVVLRFFKNETQSEIGKKLGMSQVQVSRLEQKIIKKMRKICQA